MSERVAKKEQSERTRARILDAAITLFSQHGYASTSMSDLARAIDMTPGVLYWHFRSKEDLLIASLQELQLRLSPELDLGARNPRLVSGGTARAVRNMIDRVASVVERNQPYLLFVGVVGAEATDTSPRVEEALRAAYRTLARVVEKVLSRGVEERVVDPALDLECAAELFLGMYLGGIMHQRLFRDDFPLSRALPVLTSMLQASLVGRAHAS